MSFYIIIKLNPQNYDVKNHDPHFIGEENEAQRS